MPLKVKPQADMLAIAKAFSKKKVATAHGDQKRHKKNIIRDPVDYEDQRYN